MTVTFTRHAERDLEAIGDYIARDNPARALSFVIELRERCFSLADFPERFPLVSSHEATGVRKLVHGSYVALYRAASAEVVVLRIVNGAVDYPSLL